MRQLPGSEKLVFVPGRDMVWLLNVSYTSMESCRANWRAANVKTDCVPAAVECPSVDVRKMDVLVILLEKGAGSM